MQEVKTYRLYFNCRQDAPRVWSYDEGQGTAEHVVEDVELISCNARFVFDSSKHLPEASAWIEVTGRLYDCGGKITVHG